MPDSRTPIMSYQRTWCVALTLFLGLGGLVLGGCATESRVRLAGAVETFEVGSGLAPQLAAGDSIARGMLRAGAFDGIPAGTRLASSPVE